MNKNILVIKFGSAVLTDENGNINQKVITTIASEVAQLSLHYTVILVSSGAVACGKKAIDSFKGTLVQRKAAAAVGNPILISLYQKYFSVHRLTVAQALCERHHFSNRKQFLQLQETFNEFWKNNIIPIVNENDLVSNVELKFSDNDELATLLSIGFHAQRLVLCTSAGGFYNQNQILLPAIKKIDAPILSCIQNKKSATGLGGMLSKITFTQLATSLGIEVFMTGLDGKQPIQSTLAEKKGSFFHAQKSTLKARQKWLMSGSVTTGEILIDEGAEKAVQNRKSLLTVGILLTSGNFDAGQVVQIINQQQAIIGVAKTRLSSNEILQFNNHKNKLAAHANDIVLF